MEETLIPDPQFYYEKAHRKTSWHGGDLRVALDFIKAHSFRPHGRVCDLLEIGCGMGDLAGQLSSSTRYVGVDPVLYCIEQASRSYPNAEFSQAQAETLPFSNEAFDIVFSHQVLEMLAQPRQSLFEMMRVVRPGGYVMIIAPNLEVPWSEIRAVRHYSTPARFVLSVQRWFDFLLRPLGRLPFRTINQNYIQATGKFERGDDDLQYITSAYEVAKLFESQGLQIVQAKHFQPKDNSWQTKIKSTLAHLPMFKYYNSGMCFIFKKSKLRQNRENAISNL